MAVSATGPAPGPQNWELKRESIRRSYLAARRADPSRFERRIDLSWSVWMFGTEAIGASLERLARNGLRFVELKADRWTPDSGSPAPELRAALRGAGIRVSGACGMFSSENDLSSPSVYSRQNAIDYIRRELELLAELEASYLIVVPTAVGRPAAADGSELARSAEALRSCGEAFAASGVKAAIEPIRAAEVSLVHSVSDALRYIEAVGHPSIAHVNADLYHMSLEEDHVGEAILEAGERLVNLHLADSNRDALGTGSLDLDTAIMASYLVGMNREGRFLTAEPLGPYPNPYVLANGPCDVAVMDALVADTLACFREREEQVRSLVG
jgi:D-psicose/D-tagatose/L-ribulose 3-epimerase